MNSNELLDALKDRLDVPSDYALAKKILKVDVTAIRDMRERGLSDARALQIATLLDLDPAAVLASVHAERAKDPQVKKVWEKLAKTIRAAAAGVLIVLGMGITAPEPLQAAQVSPGIHYAKYRRPRAWRAVWLAILGTLSAFRGRLTTGNYSPYTMRALPLALLILTGCGSETGRDNHGYGYQYDQIGATGLRVRYAGTQLPSLADIEKLYQETEACTGISATGPLLIITDPIPGNGTAYGSTFLDTGTVFISSWLDTDIRLSFWTYKHEFVHYLLHQSGFDITANANHQSPLFADCTQPSP